MTIDVEGLAGLTQQHDQQQPKKLLIPRKDVPAIIGLGLSYVDALVGAHLLHPVPSVSTKTMFHWRELERFCDGVASGEIEVPPIAELRAMRHGQRRRRSR